MDQIREPMSLPSHEGELEVLHFELGDELYGCLRALGEVFAVTFGEGPTHAALRSLSVDACFHGAAQEERRASFDRIGWRAYLDEENERTNELLDLMTPWRDGAAYASQGVAPNEPYDVPVSNDDRKRRIKALITQGEVILKHGHRIFDDIFLDIWKGVAARSAIDFGGTVTLEGLKLLSGVSLGAVRNAVSIGELHPDDAGRVDAGQAKAWLARRRDFCPSRWENLNDGQEVLNLERIAQPDEAGMIFVPQDSDGKPFTPEHVVRTAKSGPGLSITIGAKGLEEQHRDYYEALVALAKMDVPRWRRRNDKGNWGIVRARGSWTAVSKAEIDRQLAAKAAEVA